MPALNDTVAKLFQTSKVIVYLDGDPSPYTAEIVIPKVISEMIEYDNSSMGGKVEFADPWRRGIDSAGSIKFDQDSSSVTSKISDSSKIVTMKVSAAVAAISTTLGAVAPLPQKYTLTVQFSEYDPGTIAPGKKREVTASYNVFSMKFESAGVTVYDYDFIGGIFKNNGVDILSAVNAII